MGNAESGISDEEDLKDIMDQANSGEEVIRVFQPQKLRQELENGKSTSTLSTSHKSFFEFLIFSRQASNPIAN